jgi:hypothetical protein
LVFGLSGGQHPLEMQRQSISRIGVLRNQVRKWLSPQENATLHVRQKVLEYFGNALHKLVQPAGMLIRSRVRTHPANWRPPTIR